MVGIDAASVGSTAVITAHMRALESTRVDRLFSDDLASPLVSAAGLGVEGITLEQVSGTRVYESVAARTHFIDLWCERLIADGAQQVVILGAGLDTRTWRFDWLERGLHVWELDRTDVVGLKREVLDIAATDTWHGVEVDLLDSRWCETLTADGFRWDTPTIWIAEGLFMYLPDEAARSVVDAITTRTSAPASLIVVHSGRGAVADSETRAMSDAMRQQGYGFESVIATDPQDWLGSRWRVDEAISIAEYATHQGRSIGYDESAIGAEVAWLFCGTSTGI